MMVRGDLYSPIVRSKTAAGVRPGLFLPEYMGKQHSAPEHQTAIGIRIRVKAPMEDMHQPARASCAQRNCLFP
jgi:hypothetical protein